MSEKKDNENTTKAICPSCNKQINIDSSDAVVFCEQCNNPFKVEEAIKLYNDNIKRNQAAKKPSDEATAKFNTILKKDYKLAEDYLDDIIKKEYPSECQKLLSFRLSEKNSFHKSCLYSSLNEQGGLFYFVTEIWYDIRSVNTYIADMYYQILRRHVNALYEKENNRYYSGGLVFLKLKLWDFETRLSNIRSNSLSYDIYEWDHSDLWAMLVSNITEEKSFFKDYDDEYVYNLITAVKNFQSSIITFPDYPNTVRLSCTEALRRKGKNTYELIIKLEDFYSPAKKKQVKTEREEAEQKEKERKYNEALEKETAFWRKYIDLLKSGKAKKALALLEETKKPSETDEFAKFKKSLFGVKYTGESYSLSARRLAELSIDRPR